MVEHLCTLDLGAKFTWVAVCYFYFPVDVLAFGAFAQQGRHVVARFKYTNRIANGAWQKRRRGRLSAFFVFGDTSSMPVLKWHRVQGMDCCLVQPNELLYVQFFRWQVVCGSSNHDHCCTLIWFGASKLGSKPTIGVDTTVERKT